MKDLAYWLMDKIEQEKALTHHKPSAHAAWAKVEAYRHVLSRVDEVFPLPTKKKGRKLPITFSVPTIHSHACSVQATVGKRDVFHLPFWDDYGKAYVPDKIANRVAEICAQALNAHGNELRALLDTKE